MIDFWVTYGVITRLLKIVRLIEGRVVARATVYNPWCWVNGIAWLKSDGGGDQTRSNWLLRQAMARDDPFWQRKKEFVTRCPPGEVAR